MRPDILTKENNMEHKIKTMKFIITAIAISVTVASSGFASELKHSGIIESKSWITGGDDKGFPIAGHIEHHSSISKSSSSARASASTSDIYARVNTNFYARGSHGYSINNTSGRDQYYTTEIKLCAGSNYCFHEQERVGVVKNGNFSDDATIHLANEFSVKTSKKA